jgi:hypothetical protein
MDRGNDYLPKAALVFWEITNARGIIESVELKGNKPE